MMVAILLFLAVAAIGHAAFWVGLVNRWHATGFPRAVVKVITLVFYAGLVAPPAMAAWWLVWERSTFCEGRSADMWPLESAGARAYLVCCAAYGAAHLVIWLRWRRRPAYPTGLVAPLDERVLDIAQRLGFAPALGVRTALFRRVPANQLWQVRVAEYAVEFPHLSSSLEGFSIAHWSDLHFSGRIDRSYFHEIVRVTNELCVDLVALTGDICDAAVYIDWIPETLTPLEARFGKFFILGNHDLRTHDVQRLRAAVRLAGFADIAGRTESIAEGAMLLAGDERPWFSHAPSNAELDRAPAEALRVLLAHTPDRLAWARSQRFDLMLAGHTHGGQICFPLIGPVICPSWHGTKYASGFFYEPPTLLHVSRGTASLMPLRINCPPEITKLVLRRARSQEA